MIFQIESDKGIGAVSFGLSRDQIRKMIDVQPQILPNKARTNVPTDFFPSVGLFVHYDEVAKCEAIELVKPAAPVFQGQHLLDRSFRQLKTWMMSSSNDAKLEEDGIRSDELGIGIYAPLGDEKPDDPPEGVIVYEKGYYEKDVKF